MEFPQFPNTLFTFLNADRYKTYVHLIQQVSAPEAIRFVAEVERITLKEAAKKKRKILEEVESWST